MKTRTLLLMLPLALGAGVMACSETPTAPTKGIASGSARAVPTPSPTPSVTPTPSPSPSPQPVLVQFLGAVTDEDGTPLVGANVGVEYRDSFGRSQWKDLTTIAGGRYSTHLPAKAGSLYSLPDGLALVYAWSGSDWDFNVQAVAGNQSENEVNFRLSRRLNVTPGDSVTLTVDNSSSLCIDWDTIINFQARCGNVYLTANATGLLTVEAQPLSPGGVVPLVELVYYGTAKPGKASAQVKARDFVQVRIQIPSDIAPQQYLVTTSMSMNAK